MFVARKRYIRSRVAAVLMQKIWKGALQRPIYVTMLEEAKEEARVNTKLAALQKRLADAEMKWILADKARVEAEKRADGTSVSSVVVDEKKEEQEQKEKEEQPVESSDDQKALLDESTK
jgi:folate-dependent phosphoribosylglycinamide formyltransferase PurN